MNDLFSIISGMIMHSYLLVIGCGVMLIPAKMLHKSFNAKFPL